MLKIKAFCLSSIGLFSSFSTFAQLTTASQIVGGSAEIGLSQSNFGVRPHLNINPQYGKMLNDHWFVSANAKVGTKDYYLSESYYSSKPSTLRFSTFTTGASAGLGYIFNPESKLQVYGSAQLNFEREEFLTKEPWTLKKTTIGTTLSLGVFKQINPEMMLDANVGFTYGRAHYVGVNNQTANRNESDLAFNVGFRNIVPLSRSKDKTPPQYLAAGRSVIGGNLGISAESIAFNAEYAYFLTKNIRVGASAFYNNNFNSVFRNTNYGLTAEARYYLPITKRLSAFGSAAFSVEKDGRTRLSLGAGLNYFISKRAALEVNLLNTSFTNKAEQSAFLGPKLKFTYFLK